MFPALDLSVKAVGKHKYVRHMSEFLFDLHYVYPGDLLAQAAAGGAHAQEEGDKQEGDPREG